MELNEAIISGYENTIRILEDVKKLQTEEIERLQKKNQILQNALAEAINKMDEACNTWNGTIVARNLLNTFQLKILLNSTKQNSQSTQTIQHEKR